MKRILGVMVVGVVFFAGAVSWPCVTVADWERPFLSGVVGPEPLLVSEGKDELWQYDGDGEGPPVPSSTGLAREDRAELRGLRDLGGSPLQFSRPVGPLDDGTYYLYAGTGFTVDAGLRSEVPAPPDGGSLRAVPREEEAGGCCSGIPCLPAPSSETLWVDVAGTTPRPAFYVLEIADQAGRRARRLVKCMQEDECRFPVRHLEELGGNAAEMRACVRAAGMSWTGEIGAFADLGCSHGL